jgi:hypothetical protein
MNINVQAGDTASVSNIPAEGFPQLLNIVRYSTSSVTRQHRLLDNIGY